MKKINRSPFRDKVFNFYSISLKDIFGALWSGQKFFKFECIKVLIYCNNFNMLFFTCKLCIDTIFKYIVTTMPCIFLTRNDVGGKISSFTGWHRRVLVFFIILLKELHRRVTICRNWFKWIDKLIKSVNKIMIKKL